VVKLTLAQMVNLRSRQNLVLSERDSIWQQVRDRMMPPSGKFASYRQLKAIFDSKEGEPCAKSKQFTTTSDGDAQEVLRNWLACGAPIVEVNSSVVQKNAVVGQAGFQYPECGGGSTSEDDDTPGMIVSLATLLDGPLSTCTSCHPGASKPDLKTVATAAMTINSDDVVCNGKPYVTKGDPDQSFLYDVVSKDDPGCKIRRMPIGGKLPAAQLKLIRDWIKAGAPLNDDDIEQPSEDSDENQSDSESDAGATRDGGADAGVRDAGRSDAGAADAGRRDAGR
jgi:hypothetical protein